MGGAAPPRTVVPLARLAARVVAAPGPVRLVAVDGPAGSGKTTLAARLARALGGAPVVPIDDFCSWTDLDGWWPRLCEELVLPLLAGREASYGVRDWEGDPDGLSTCATRTVRPAPVVILEGVGAARASLAERLALAVWVEAPDALRLDRGLARDGEHQRDRWLAWRAMEAAHFARDRTRERADVRVDGAPPENVPHDAEAEVVLLPG